MSLSIKLGAVFGRSRHWFLAAFAAAVSLFDPPHAAAQATLPPKVATPPKPTPAEDAAKRDALAKKLAAVLAAAGNASATTIEARLTFEVSQLAASCSVALGALGDVQAQAKTAAAKTAVANAIAAATKCEANGTGGLADRQQTLQDGTTLGLPGGTSNYQQQ